MNVTLRPEDEELIAQAMETGAYRTPEEVIRRALEVLHTEDEWLHDHGGEINEKIERALGQFDRGEFLSAEESRIDMDRRKAEWMREHNR